MTTLNLFSPLVVLNDRQNLALVATVHPDSLNLIYDVLTRASEGQYPHSEMLVAAVEVGRSLAMDCMRFIPPTDAGTGVPDEDDIAGVARWNGDWCGSMGQTFFVPFVTPGEMWIIEQGVRVDAAGELRDGEAVGGYGEAEGDGVGDCSREGEETEESDCSEGEVEEDGHQDFSDGGGEDGEED